MADSVIVIENLSKKYRIGATQQRHDTLRDLIADTAKQLNPFKRSKIRDPENENVIWALNDINLTIMQGEVTGVIGHNGAGKTTLLKILSRITEPTKGRIELSGRVGSLLEVGTGFHPELTGRENIYMNGAFLGMHRKEIDKKFDEIVAFSEIEKFLDTPVKRYSSGMYVRLAFAVAAHLETEILLVDEVLAVGDINFQNKCLGKMEEVAERQGRTILFISHNLTAVQRLCPKSILLSGGRIIASGSSREIIAGYLAANDYATPPMKTIDLKGASRSGTGEAHFVDLCYSSTNKSFGYQSYANGPVEILLTIESNQPRFIGSFAATFYDQYGTKLVNADIIALNRTLDLKKGINKIKVTIEKLYLNAGTYTLGLWMANPTGTIYDHIREAAKLEVINPGLDYHIEGTVPVSFDVKEGL